MPPVRTRISRAERRAETRERLIDAAERRFKRDGFHATSVDAVAEEAGFTKGAVYSNFASKEALFFAVYERHVAQRVAELDAVVAAAPSTRAELRAAVAGADRHRDDGWLAVFFEFWAHVLRHPQHRARFAELHRRGLQPLIRSIEAGAAARPLALPPALLATAQLALGNGLQLERLTRPEDVGTDAFQEAMWLFARAAAGLDDDDEQEATR
jgi:AcrR family transcriptional regulator